MNNVTYIIAAFFLKVDSWKYHDIFYDFCFEMKQSGKKQ